ncbi:hypothetical protein FALCPG4_015004 [Fusarium falciforme]
MGDIVAFRLPLSCSTQYARPFLLQSAELCKFALVDWRAPHPESVQQRGRSLALDRLYKMHLLEHRRNDRLEQARVVARGDPMQYHLKFVQYWAHKMLHEYEAAVEREVPLTDQTAPHVWASIVPKDPALSDNWLHRDQRWHQ